MQKQPKKQIPKDSANMCLDHIHSEYIDYCNRYKEEPETKHLLQYLFDCNIITHRVLIRYFVVFLFEDFFNKSGKVKTLALWDMENYLPIGWRQMTEIRKRYTNWFKRK